MLTLSIATFINLIITEPRCNLGRLVSKAQSRYVNSTLLNSAVQLTTFKVLSSFVMA